ncbi:hypothetical protein LJR220_003057 [Bradyrhizobium sp. LjRoot220]|uniref:hypothetical protein n=1 Tax=Bradyrhizobium sp. LjRoot220 TaxID=3342284 RepID=UPI003ECDF226
MSTTYAEACCLPELFGPWFDGDTEAGSTWDTWRVLDKAIFGDPLDPDELRIFTELTGRTEPQSQQATEAWIIAGRRSGKDVKAASIVVYLATIANEERKFTDYLTPGETGVIQLLAVDRIQAAVCLKYVTAMFEQPLLKPYVKDELSDGIELTNGLMISITTNDKRRVRGRTVVACVLDEVAYWLSTETTVNPDTAVYDALKPAMATIPGALLIGISSPYAHRGLLYSKYKKHFKKNGDNVLVVKAPTWRMNPTLSRDHGVIADAYADDQQAASAEYGAEFRTDVSAFVAQSVIDACVDSAVAERAPNHETQYVAFADPSGGSSDSFTLAIAHAVGAYSILDCVREVPAPFHPATTVAELCVTIKSYGLTTVTGDRYASQWVVSEFAEHGVEYVHSERNRSELYLDLLPRLNSGTARLLDIKRLSTQLGNLERRTARGGRDTVDHAPGAHDDVANAVAGAVTLCQVDAQYPVEVRLFRFRDQPPPEKPAPNLAPAIPLGSPPPVIGNHAKTARLMTEAELLVAEFRAGPYGPSAP